MPAREDSRQVVEERVCDGLELGEPVALFRCVRGERAEPVVLPTDVVAASVAVCDPQPTLPRQPDQPAVSEQRSEDDLELDRVRWDAAEREPGMLDHANECGQRLRPPKSARKAGVNERDAIDR